MSPTIPSGETCFLGCGTQATPPAQDATGWWTIKFTAPFNDDPGCASGFPGTLQSISIIFDETGTVVLDNITIKRQGQTTVIGAP